MLFFLKQLTYCTQIFGLSSRAAYFRKLLNCSILTWIAISRAVYCLIVSLSSRLLSVSFFELLGDFFDVFREA